MHVFGALCFAYISQLKFARMNARMCPIAWQRFASLIYVMILYYPRLGLPLILPYIPCVCCMPYAVLTPTSHAYPIISFQHQRLILHSRQSEQGCVGNARSPGRQERHRGKFGEVVGSAGLMKFLTQFTATTAKHNTEIEAEARRSCLPLSWSRRRRVTQGRSGRFDAIYAKTQPRRHRCLVAVRRRWAHLAATLHHKYATHLAIM